MNRSIVKLGGSVLRQPRDLSRVVDIVRKYRVPPIIVVSAFAGVTDTLVGTSDKLDRKKLLDLEDIDHLERRAGDFLAWPDSSIESGASSNLLEIRLHRLKKIFEMRSGSCHVETRRQLILSYGERIASLVIVEQLRRAGIPACEATPDEIGLFVNDSARGPEIDIDRSRPRLQKALRRDEVLVIPGFYGTTPFGVIRLLGRNGSDYSAAGIAACIDAISLDLYKDVPGICTGNPKLVDSAGTIPSLTYAEAETIAHFGGNILHGMTIEPLAVRGIPIHIFGPRHNPHSRPDTIVNDKIDRDTSGPLAIVYLPEMREKEFGYSAKLTSNAKAPEFPGPRLFTDKSINSRERRSLITLVGRTSGHDAGMSARLIRALCSRGLETKILGMGSSRLSASVITREDDGVPVLKALHDEIFHPVTISELRIHRQPTEDRITLPYSDSGDNIRA